MPDIREVYEMVTKQRPPEPGALERQQKRQVRAARNKKIGAFAVAAAIGLVAAVLILVNRPGGNATTPADEVPTVNPAEAEAGAVGTVTFDGSTCSMEITADRIEPGVVLFELVNATEKREMFDSYQLSEGYSLRAFAAAIERGRRQAEDGKPLHFFPGKREVSYLGNEVIPANSSGSVVTTMSPGRHAIVCMDQYGGPGLPFGVVGPIVVRKRRTPPPSVWSKGRPRGTLRSSSRTTTARCSRRCASSPETVTRPPGSCRTRWNLAHTGAPAGLRTTRWPLVGSDGHASTGNTSGRHPSAASERMPALLASRR